MKAGDDFITPIKNGNSLNQRAKENLFVREIPVLGDVPMGEPIMSQASMFRSAAHETKSRR